MEKEEGPHGRPAVGGCAFATRPATFTRSRANRPVLSRLGRAREKNLFPNPGGHSFNRAGAVDDRSGLVRRRPRRQTLGRPGEKCLIGFFDPVPDDGEGDCGSGGVRY